ncbi:hypothetical protein UG55_107116 [Frankia sp. EI5c]|nr:hypothetical protein UG55_107116 [Frankia sp. EI5c]
MGPHRSYPNEFIRDDRDESFITPHLPDTTACPTSGSHRGRACPTSGSYRGRRSAVGPTGRLVRDKPAVVFVFVVRSGRPQVAHNRCLCAPGGTGRAGAARGGPGCAATDRGGAGRADRGVGPPSPGSGPRAAGWRAVFTPGDVRPPGSPAWGGAVWRVDGLPLLVPPRPRGCAGPGRRGPLGRSAQRRGAWAGQGQAGGPSPARRRSRRRLSGVAALQRHRGGLGSRGRPAGRLAGNRGAGSTVVVRVGMHMPGRSRSSGVRVRATPSRNGPWSPGLGAAVRVEVGNVGSVSAPRPWRAGLTERVAGTGGRRVSRRWQPRSEDRGSHQRRVLAQPGRRVPRPRRRARSSRRRRAGIRGCSSSPARP